MKIYLAGPMRGYAEFNFPAFHYAAAKLRAEGHEVFSPAEKGEEKELTADSNLQEKLAFRRKVFRIDTTYICDEAEQVALLPGWEFSPGARAERALGEAIGLSIRILGKDYVQMRHAVEEAMGGVHARAHDSNVVAANPPRRPDAGPGSAKSRATLPTDPKLRKMLPVCTGVLDYFPDALCAVAFVSYMGNKQHNPGKPLHWDRSKSTDEEDTEVRHLMERGSFDTEGCLHSAKRVWRALASLQKEIEANGGHLFDPAKVEKLLSQ